MKRKKTKAKKQNIKIPKREIKIRRSPIRNSNQRRAERRRKLKRKYRRRRIALLLILIFIIYLAIYKTIDAVIGYKNYDYPSLRDDVRKDIQTSVYNSDSTGRSLTVAEKMDDINQLFEIIRKNALMNKDVLNNDKWKVLKQEVEETILNSKTDEQFYDGLKLIENKFNSNNIHFMDKNEYEKAKSYYDSTENSQVKKILDDPISQGRYHRMIENKDSDDNMTLKLSDDHLILTVKISEFKESKIKNDKEKLEKMLKEYPSIEQVILDLSSSNGFSVEYAKAIIIPSLFTKNINQNYNYVKRQDLESGKEKIKYIDYGIYKDAVIETENFNTDIKAKKFKLHIAIDKKTQKAPLLLSKIAKDSANADIFGLKATGDMPAKTPRYYNLSHSGIIFYMKDNQVVGDKNKNLAVDVDYEIEGNLSEKIYDMIRNGSIN